MTEIVGGSKKEHDNKGNNWNRTIVKHLAAWFILLIAVLLIWKILQPVWPKESPKAGKKATSTTTVTLGEVVRPSGDKATIGEKHNISLPSGTDRVQVIVDSLNMLKAPNNTSGVVGRLTRGTIVAVESRDDEWLKIRTVENKVGYIGSSPELIREAP